MRQITLTLEQRLGMDAWVGNHRSIPEAEKESLFDFVEKLGITDDLREKLFRETNFGVQRDKEAWARNSDPMTLELEKAEVRALVLILRDISALQVRDMTWFRGVKRQVTTLAADVDKSA